MPKPEQGQNVRSRKTSHYLGLFKENEQELKKAEEKSKDKHNDLIAVRESHDDRVHGASLLVAAPRRAAILKPHSQ
jgi:hypothetical protein